MLTRSRAACSFFTDFGREAGREAFLSSIRTHVVEGSADGVWLDNFNQIPFNCSGGGGECTALRSKDPVNNASTVTAAQVAAYRKGKEAATTAAVKMVSSKRGVVAAIACSWRLTCTRPNPNGAEMGYLSQDLVENFRSNVTGLVALVDEAFSNGYTYLLIEISRSLGGPDTEARGGCIEEVGIAAFLLAAREGCFLQCRGTPGNEIERPIGEPLGRAVVSSDGKMLRRNFSSGVQAWWRLGTETGGVNWGREAAPRPDSIEAPLAVTPRQSLRAGGGPCSTGLQCNLNGVCRGGKCVCDAAWSESSKLQLPVDFFSETKMSCCACRLQPHGGAADLQGSEGRPERHQHVDRETHLHLGWAGDAGAGR